MIIIDVLLFALIKFSNLLNINKNNALLLLKVNLNTMSVIKEC